MPLNKQVRDVLTDLNNVTDMITEEIYANHFKKEVFASVSNVEGYKRKRPHRRATLTTFFEALDLPPEVGKFSEHNRQSMLRNV